MIKVTLNINYKNVAGERNYHVKLAYPLEIYENGLIQISQLSQALKLLLKYQKFLIVQ